MRILPYVKVAPWGWWVFMWKMRQFVGLFRNKPGVIKWRKGKLLPRRWGFYVLGLEVGDRG